MYNSGHHHHNKPVAPVPSPESAAAADIFEQLCAASTFKSVLHHYRHLCDVLRLKPTNIRNFYPKLKAKLRSWKAQALWSKFDKRASHKCYNHGKACVNSKVLIIGAGPCGLRSAIEAQLLGAKVVVVEKRDRFSRNNVLHLWPFVINDLRQLGAKKFYGKFCAGAIDHISIRQLQCILLKVALLLGVEVFENVSFEELVEPPEDQNEKIGWRAKLSPLDHPANQYEFDVLIGADGKRNTLSGFKRKEFRGKLAIAITANFINKRSEAEARVQEISGVAFIFNQKFFKELYAATGIDLENIVYYKDETHYFVMTAKKHSLIDKGVILNDLADTQELLHPRNVDRNALLGYAREAADFSTSYQLPHLDFAVNHYGKPDIAMFDFTSMFAADNACRIIERKGHKLLSGLVGDSLLEPFWPTGSGCARGFLSCFDACWMIRSWAAGKMMPLEVLAERESIYRLLAQTTPENLNKDHSSYALDPASRYPTINLRAVLPFQVRTLFDTDDPVHLEEVTNPHLVNSEELPKKRKRRDSFIHPDTLLVWCKKQVALYSSVRVENMTSSFKDGRALCAIIHRYRPDLIDFESVRPEDIAQNNQLAFDILERDFGIPPVMTGREMAECEVPDKLSMISYLSQIYDVFRGEIPHFKYPKMDDGEMEVEGLTQRSTPHVNILKNLTNKSNSAQGTPASKKRQTLEKGAPKKDDGRITCRLVEESDLAAADKKLESLKKTKKRKSDKVTSPQDDIESQQRREEILSNRIERLRKQKERRELDTVRFIRSMQMLQCGVSAQTSLPPQPSYNREDDTGLAEYRKNCGKTMREKAQDLEMKLYGNAGRGDLRKVLVDQSDDFSDKVKDLEAKFTGTSNAQAERKPKDLIRAIGKIEKSDWNMVAIEKKMEESKHPLEMQVDRERVPRWNKEIYEDKFHNIERRLRENGEDEETIAKYRDIDASLKRLEMKLREGSTLETGLRGQNKVSNLASQLSSKLEKKETEKVLVPRQPSRPMVPLPMSGSDLCHFCGNRVYLVERLSAEGKFFHRQCFKCDYCAANLRLGNYIYDREGRYGGKFFCIPHFGLSQRTRGLRRRAEDTDSAKENIVPQATQSTSKLQVPVLGSGDVPGGTLGALPTTPATAATPEDRGTTPERVEFENSMVEQSDEDEYLSEDEWTDRNFGASANELDDSDGDDDSDYSDLSDEEVEGEVDYESGQPPLTAAETRRLAESWQRRYSTDRLDDEDEAEFGHESESDLDSDNYSEEYGAEGDDSHTATEGEGCEEDEEEEEGEAVKRARELRRMEVNIDVAAPPRKAETSDSGSDTELASDEESEESDTQIDTDSEFAEDHVQPGPPKEIPTIVIDESLDVHHETTSTPTLVPCKEWESRATETPQVPGEPRKDFVSQKVDLGEPESRPKENDTQERAKDEKSASLTKLDETGKVNPRAEQLKRLLQRTESTEAIAAKKALQLKRQYLLGEASNLPRKSVSTADLGNRFKSFMDKISETQKMLNPAPQPSAAMQAFMNSSASNSKVTNSSPSSPQLPARSVSLPQGDTSSESPSVTRETKDSYSPPSVTTQEATQDITTRLDSSVCPVEVECKVEDDQLKGFPLPAESTKNSEAPHAATDEVLARIPVSESSSDTSKSLTSGNESDYDNVPCGSKPFAVQKSVSAIEIRRKPGVNLDLEIYNSIDVSNDVKPTVQSENNSANSTLRHEPLPESKEIHLDDRASDQNDKSMEMRESVDIVMRESGEEEDEFGLSVPGESEGVETINRELVLQNAPRSLEGLYPDIPKQDEVQAAEKAVSIVSNDGDKSEQSNVIESPRDNVDELFEKLASDAIVDINKFSDLIESPVDKPVNIVGSVNLHSSNETVTSCDKQSDENVPSVVKDVDVKPEVEIIVDRVSDAETLKTDDKLSPSLSASEDSDHSENKFLGKSEAVSSPEGKENTEFELSDWAADNDGISAGEDLEVEVNERSRLSVKKKGLNTIARIASEESLGDTDSAISTGPSKTTSVPSKPYVLGDLEGIEYMDTSESTSSPDDIAHRKGYRKLEEETPTTPLAPQISMIGLETAVDVDMNVRESKSSDSLSTEVEDSSQSSVQEAINSSLITDMYNAHNVDDGKTGEHATKEPRSISEPPSLCENKLTAEQRRDSLDDYASPKRYEGYIPRFKERMSPFGYVRDSLDIQRSSSKTALFTPTKQDIEDREKNEERLDSSLLPNHSVETKSVVSPNTAKKQIETSLRNKDKDKEKDLIREMVMSRISRKTPEKTQRRGSRTSSCGSRTSLFSPQSSQENLLEKTGSLEAETTLKDSEAEAAEKKVVHADRKALLRLDTIKPDLPEGGQSFEIEQNRSKVRVGTIFRDDSVLGDQESFNDIQKPVLPDSGETLAAEEGRSKVRVGTIFRDDSVLGCISTSERVSSSMPQLPESGQTFEAELKRSKVQVGSLFREDSVLGDPSLKQNTSELKLPEDGSTFDAEKDRSKVRVGTVFREDSVLGVTNQREMVQESGVPFADDSLDEEVFVNVDDKAKTESLKKDAVEPTSVGSKNAQTKTVTGKELQSPPHLNLPATLMTHPEKFDNLTTKGELCGVPSGTVSTATPVFSSSEMATKRELFGVPSGLSSTTTPAFSSTEMHSTPAPLSSVSSLRAQTTTTPAIPVRKRHGQKGFSNLTSNERPLSTPNLSSVDRERVREEARVRARLKTDLDLGLSPPSLADNLRLKLRKGSLSESEDRDDQGSVKAGGRDVKVTLPKDKDERVRELLAEQREHKQRDPEGRQQEWNKKDDRLRERLEEYRQRRRESTKNNENGDSQSNNSQLVRRHTHRPSLLELESLQVFTSPNTGVPAPTTSTTIASVIPNVNSSPQSIISTSCAHQSSLATAHPSPVMATPVAAGQPSQESTSTDKTTTTEKKSGKKSKDRERRRSLIQVFTGMFKSNDDKKKTEQQASDATDCHNGNKNVVTSSGAPTTLTIASTTAPTTTSAPVDTPKTAPKSPSTMRDKLSRLRLSRSKDKKKLEKGRSNSADLLDDRGSSDDTRSAFSLPTSPSRHPFPSLVSPRTKASTPPQASGIAYSSSKVHLATQRIEEESLSDDDGSTGGTPMGTLEGGLQAPWSGSSSRRQRNTAMRAARQAELKRLRMAQEIQRQLEECEVKTRELEERGVAVEKALRGEAVGANRDEAELMGDWFAMVHEKNALVRWEQELMVRAKELELEDRHVRLEHELRHRMSLSEHEKSRQDIDREGTILAEMLSILEQKDALVTMLEEDRQRCGQHHHHHHSTTFLSSHNNTILLNTRNILDNLIVTLEPSSIPDSQTDSSSLTTELKKMSESSFSPSYLSPFASVFSYLNHRQVTNNASSSMPLENQNSNTSKIMHDYSQQLVPHFLPVERTINCEHIHTNKPSVFNISQPSRRNCAPIQHVYKKDKSYSVLSRIRYNTMPDHSCGIDGSVISNPSLSRLYHRFSNPSSFPLIAHKENLRNRNKCNKSGIIITTTVQQPNSNLFNTACSLAVVLVVGLCIVPCMLDILPLLFSKSYSGPSPF